MRIGVVSDNHRLIDPALGGILAGVDEIWHAGDLVTGDILPALKRIAPVVAVRGNNDVVDEVAELPDEHLIVREGVRILIRHIVGLPPRLDREARKSIERQRPAIVVMGHSHQPAATQEGGILYLNPGSCGPRRFSLPRAAARLELTPVTARVVVFELGGGELVSRDFRLDR